MYTTNKNIINLINELYNLILTSILTDISITHNINFYNLLKYKTYILSDNAS